MYICESDAGHTDNCTHVYLLNSHEQKSHYHYDFKNPDLIEHFCQWHNFGNSLKFQCFTYYMYFPVYKPNLEITS